MESSFSMRR
jgi:hypothetical protein